ncbi:sigma-54-dependent transcriptional regulator [Nannocystis pusilla]|uniref:Sigma-54 dependent transcriptional regulator n=1 Tax=Nannocystis pusilla TaxID=889268 RepID=A0ABS7TKR8_9BACT|nr:sigma-54 dependent transcriptional regulator [Nannocystis pusilla]MBZ5708823.1 sigma-54 dependent transcriptional regulator [Nannocystis pusilla]
MSRTELDPSTMPSGPARPHVVVIDDEKDLCELIALRLEHNGYHVTCEQTARGGIEVLEREVVDAVVLDLRLDGENGLDLLAAIQQRSLDLPVVILTAHGTIETAVEALQRGAYGFLTKPFDAHELLQKLAHAVERVRLRREIANLRRMLGKPGISERLLGTSARIAAARDLIQRIAPAEATVLVTGESGSGKEVAARSIHAHSSRRDGPFLAINCGALPTELLESELFGHVRGAFTGALRDKDGLFAAAEGGTLLLDEIGDAPPAVQVKLLRVLQERCYYPVGSTEARSTDVRVIAVTNKDLQAEVDAGRFREDLFYRLHVVPIVLPPLREHPEDIPLLAELFLTRAATQYGLPAPHLSHEALRLLMSHDWPGNVRELANVVEGAALLTTDGVLRPAHVLAVLSRRRSPAGEHGAAVAAAPPDTHVMPDATRSLLAELPPLREARDAFDRAYLQEVLRRCGGNVSAAAKMAGRNRTDFHELLRRHAIVAADYRG